MSRKQNYVAALAAAAVTAAFTFAAPAQAQDTLKIGWAISRPDRSRPVLQSQRCRTTRSG